MHLLKHKLIRTMIFFTILVAVPVSTLPADASKQCGSGGDAVVTTVDLGCKGCGGAEKITNGQPDKSCKGSCGSAICNPIFDMTYGIIRFLTAGVGLVIAGSLVVAGIQYSSSRGDPQASESAQNRIQSSLIALLIFIFAFAFLNYIIPGGLAHP